MQANEITNQAEYDAAKNIILNKPDGATNYWPHRSVYAKETSSFSIHSLFDCEDRTSTDIFVDGAWQTYKSRGFPNLVSLASIERDLFKYRRANNIFEVGDWVVVGEHQVLAQFVGYAHKGTPAELPQIDIDGRLYNSNFLAWKHTIPPCKDILSRNLSDNPKLQKLVTDYRNTDHGAEFDNFGLFDLPKSVVQSLGEIT